VSFGAVVKELDFGVGLGVEDGGVVHDVRVLEPCHLQPFKVYVKYSRKRSIEDVKMTK
jgi:hypothetical protein